MVRQLSIRMFRDLFRGDREFAVIDPRPQTAFAERHLLAASNLPQRRQVLCVLGDDDDGKAEKAVAILESPGYENTAIADAAEPHRRRQRGDRLLPIDVRSAEEHQSCCIPAPAFDAGACRARPDAVRLARLPGPGGRALRTARGRSRGRLPASLMDRRRPRLSGSAAPAV